MLKRCVGLFLALAVVLSVAPVAFAQGNGKALGRQKAPKLEERFRDWAEAAWALQYMTRMRAKGIVKGYDDGSFRPNSAVSEAEAIVMVVRMKGTETEQAAVALAGQDLGIPGMDACWWANGHVAYTLQQGWVSRDNLHPNAAAKRAWVARLMVRALVSDWQAQVVAHAGDMLPFRDASHIRSDDRAYVAIAVANSWMVGYPDGTFMPEKPVTRAELITLLDRGEAAIPGANPYEVRGVISAIDVNNRRISIATSSGSGAGYIVSPDALIFFEGSTGTAGLADLRVGDAVRVLLNANNVAIVITADRDQRDATGRVTGINLAASPRTIAVAPADSAAQVPTTYYLGANCKAYWSWNEVALSNVVVGDVVRLTTNGGTVTRIQVIQHQTIPPTGTQVTGTIRSISTGTSGTTLIIRDANGIDFTYGLAAGAQLTWGGAVITVNQLQINQAVQATIVNGQITVLVVTSQTPASTQITGTLQSVSTGTGGTTLVVRDSNTVDFTYPLAADAQLRWGTATITVSQLQTGQTVRMTVLNSAITMVEVINPPQPPAAVEITGTIQAIETSNQTVTITVRNSNSVDFRYPLAANATLTSGSVPITVSQLRTGLSVRITVTGATITTLTVISE